jgi:hypothetical protein
MRKPNAEPLNKVINPNNNPIKFIILDFSIIRKMKNLILINNINIINVYPGKAYLKLKYDRSDTINFIDIYI